VRIPVVLNAVTSELLSNKLINSKQNKNYIKLATNYQLLF